MQCNVQASPDKVVQALHRFIFGRHARGFHPGDRGCVPGRETGECLVSGGRVRQVAESLWNDYEGPQVLALTLVVGEGGADKNSGFMR